MAGFNINKYQWGALYQANPVILDPKLSHPVEREDGHGDHPRTPDATQGRRFDWQARWSRRPPGGQRDQLSAPFRRCIWCDRIYLLHT